MSKPLKFYTPIELESLSLPPRKYLLGNWLAERQPCMIYAQTGRGKSLFTMSLAIALAGGGSVYGWEAATPIPVMYVDGEMDLADVRDRSIMLNSAVEGVDEKSLNKNLKIIPRHGQSNDTIFPNLLEEAGRKQLLFMIKEHKPAVVILDNLSTLAEIPDENDSASFSPIIRLLWEIRKLDCAVILVHHTGKKEGTFRGSSKLSTTFESILQLAKNDDLISDDTGFIIKVDKYRGANQPKPMKVKLEVDDRGCGKWLYEDTGNRDLEHLVTTVQSRQFCLAKDIAEHLGISNGEISKRKRRAIQLGLITNDEWKQCLQDSRDIRSEEIEEAKSGYETSLDPYDVILNHLGNPPENNPEGGKNDDS